MPGTRGVPEVDHRLVQVVVIAEDAQGSRCQIEMATCVGGHAQPAGGEHSDNVAVGEQEHVARTGAGASNHVIGAGAHGVQRFPSWTAVLEESPAWAFDALR